MSVSFRGYFVTVEAVDRALLEFDRSFPNPGGYHNWLENGVYRYALERDGRLYPPKYILSRVTGISTEDFSGGAQTNTVFEALGFKITSLRNPPWVRDEVILALDVYMHHAPRALSDTDTPVIELSDLLRQLPIHPIRHVEPSFRNPNGVAMKLANFKSLDPEYSGVGLAASSKLDREVWDEFAVDRKRLSRTAEAIQQNFAHLDGSMLQEVEHEVEEYPEGRILTVLHRRRERSVALVQRKKDQAKRLGDGRLVCEVCSFDFAEVYGPSGDGFCECHHTRPLSTLEPNEKTRLEDLAIVCANCHRMLHRGASVRTVEELRAILAAGPYGPE